jgi:glycosyltransferase involved in cell wall biosynthesis
MKHKFVEHTVIVMPAFNAVRTLRETLEKLPMDFREVIVCDDASSDGTAAMSRMLGVPTLIHSENRGYGANQKTLYAAALERSPDAIVMIHPDNQYDASAIPSMVGRVKGGAALVLGTRMSTALKNGMPMWKYLANRALSFIQNAVFGSALSEFHSGLRAYDADIFLKMPYLTFSDDFDFDSEVIAWCMANHLIVEEVPAECRYTAEASSVGLGASIRYGLATLRVLYDFLRGKYDSRP